MSKPIEQYIECKGMLNINIRVELKRVWELTPKVEYPSKSFQPKNYTADGYIEDIIKTDIRFKDRYLLKDRMKRLILLDAEKFDLSDEEVNRQSQEILYAVCMLQKIVLASPANERATKDFKIFTDFVNMLKQQDNINPGTNFTLKLSIATKTGESLIMLPSVSDSTRFYLTLCTTIHKYLLSQAKTFEEKWYLQNAYKDHVTPNKLIEYHDAIPQFKATHKDNFLGAYMDKMLPYLIQLPQFHKSKRDKSTLSESQGRFFDEFFRLFGFYDQSFKTNLSDEGRMMTTKELRVILNRYRNA